MKIWFGTTTIKLEEYAEVYYLIRTYLVQAGHVLPFDWLDDAMINMHKPRGAVRGIKDIFRDCVMAIDASDVSIIEFTVPNFSSSHQITYSLYKRKPTLVMRLFKDCTFTDSYIEALESPFLTVKDYTRENMSALIDEFLGYSQLDYGNGRYNIVLDKRQKYYLDWASVKYKKSKSALLRELVDEKMGDDPLYAGYLKNS
jgi:hypothetical protein